MSTPADPSHDDLSHNDPSHDDPSPDSAGPLRPPVGADRDDVLNDISLPLTNRRVGKVRVGYTAPDGSLVFVTTDRLSAFDRVLACVPHKGQVLNQLSAWWFASTTDIVNNHLIAMPDPNVSVVTETEPLPIEVIVRGYITGVTDTSLWSMYAQGARRAYGHRLPDGLRKNDRLPTPIITPTTKAATGEHDVPITIDDVTAFGMLSRELWADVQEAALALFARATTIGLAAGLMLADTKYEFGLDSSGQLTLIDEVHTPDSSRWWVAESYEARRAAGDEPESLDKEVVRRAYADLGYTGNGAPPEVSPLVWEQTSERYIDAYQRLTSSRFKPAFTPGSPPIRERVTDAVLSWLHDEARDTHKSSSDREDPR